MSISFSLFWRESFIIGSRKHIAAVEQLRKELQEEEAVIIASSSNTPISETPITPEETPQAVGEEVHEEPTSQEKEEGNSKKKAKKNKNKRKPVQVLPEAIPIDNEEMSVLEMIEQLNSQNMRGRKAKNLERDEETEPRRKGKKGKKRSCVWETNKKKSTFQQFSENLTSS